MKEFETYYSGAELRQKYNELLIRMQKMMLREHELEKVVDQYANQIDNQNEMITNLLKERRERNWMNQA